MSIDPRYLTVEHWAALTAPTLLPYGNVPTSTTEKEWRQWAASARSLPALSALQIPDPRAFDQWDQWAYIFNEKIGFLGL